MCVRQCEMVVGRVMVRGYVCTSSSSPTPLMLTLVLMTSAVLWHVDMGDSR